MDWQTHKKHLLKDPAFKKALEETEPEFQLAKAIIEARTSKGLSQKQLAECLDTKQSAISRLEKAKTLPSLGFVKRIATALNTPLQVTIWP